MKKTVLFFLFLIQSMPQVFAQNVVEITSVSFDISIDIGDSLRTFEDLTKELTLEEVRARAFSKEFTGSKQPQGVYWSKFILVNRTLFDLEVVSLFDKTSYVDLYRLDENEGIFQAKSGGNRPRSQMNEGDDQNHIRFRIKAGEPQEIYIKFTNHTDYLPSLGVRLTDTIRWGKEQEKRHFRDFLLFGAIALLMIYAISLFILHRYRPYLWLALHALGMMMYSFSSRGYTANWLFPENPAVGVATPWVILGLFALFMLVMNFLETKTKHPGWHKVLIVLSGLASVLMVGSVIMMIGYGRFVLSTLMTMFFFLISVLLLTVMILSFWKRLDRPRKVFGYGVLFFVSIAVFGVISWSLIDDLGRTAATAASAIAPVGQMLIFAIALGVQMRQHEIDKNVALDDLNATLKNQNKKIEKEVVDRTAEINQQKLQLEERNDRIETLFKEVHHRVKNNLQLISSLLNMQQEWSSTQDPAKAIEDSRSRVVAMSMIHQFLYRTDDISTIDFRQYAEELAQRLDVIQVERVAFDLDIQFDKTYTFDIDTSISLGLILNELITNSYKHALLDQRSLKIGIRMQDNNSGYFKLVYSDNGKAIKEPFAEVVKRGFGLRLASRLSRQLQGRFEYSFKEYNLFTVTFANQALREQIADE